MLQSPIEFKQWSLLSEDEAMERDMKLLDATKKLTTMSLYGQGVLLIAERFNLIPFWSYFNEFNIASMLPYHNTYHSMCVMLNAYEGAMYYKLESEKIRGLLVAALLHDMNHSGGTLSDSDNIKRSIWSLNIAQKYAASMGLGLTPNELLIAQNAIMITEYPYTQTPTTIVQGIIRDADLMQPFEQDDKILYEQYIGLYYEILSKHLADNTTPPNISEFITRLDEFLQNVNWQTRWGEEKAKVLDWAEHTSRLYSLLSNGVN